MDKNITTCIDLLFDRIKHRSEYVFQHSFYISALNFLQYYVQPRVNSVLSAVEWYVQLPTNEVVHPLRT